jgi:hypothetical protein
MTNRYDSLFLAGQDASKIALLESKLAANPDDRKLRLQLANAKKRASKSEEYFLSSLEDRGIDVVNYRIEQPADEYTIIGIAKSLLSFQNSLTAVYDAVTSGPKERATYSQAVRQKTLLEFGYSYPGSRGFVLTVNNNRNLLGGDLDEAVDTLNEFFEISNTDDAIDASRKLGLGAISELYKWVDVNSQWNNSVDLNWKQSNARITGRFVTSEKFSFIRDLFARAEERIEDIIDFSGILVGLDVHRKTFHITEPEGESIKGKFSPDYHGEPLTVPGRYKAKLRQITVKTPATGKTVTTHELISLSVDG